MEPLLSLAQIIRGAPRDNLFAVVQKGFERLFEIEQLWSALDNREHIDPERLLEAGVLVELVNDDVRDRIALELNHNAHPLTVRFVAQIANAFDFLFLHQGGDLFYQPGLIDQERYFTDDDLFFTGALDNLGKGLAAHLQYAPAVIVRLNNRLYAMDKTPGRKVRPLDMLHELLDRKI